MVNAVNTVKPKMKSLFNKSPKKNVDNGYLENKLRKRENVQEVCQLTIWTVNK